MTYAASVAAGAGASTSRVPVVHDPAVIVATPPATGATAPSVSDDLGGAVLEQVTNPLGRMAGVDGHVRRAGVQGGQNGDHHVGPAFEPHGDAIADTDALLAQEIRQPHGPFGELVVCDRLGAAGRSWPPRSGFVRPVP